MSDIGTLHKRLKRLVQGSVATSGRERKLLQGCEIDPIDAIRAEISEVQIIRRVIFRNDRNMEIAFEVASGRVLNLSEPVSACLLQGCETIAMLRASPTGENKSARIAEMVASFASGATGMTVETQRLKNGPTSLEFGLPMTAIFPTQSNSNIKRPTAAKTEVLREFLEASREFSSAGLFLIDGEVQMEYGPDLILLKLRSLVENESTETVASQPMQIDPSDNCQCVIYSGHPSEGQTVLCVSHANALGVVRMSNDELEEAMAIWRLCCTNPAGIHVVNPVW